MDNKGILIGGYALMGAIIVWVIGFLPFISGGWLQHILFGAIIGAIAGFFDPLKAAERLGTANPEVKEEAKEETKEDVPAE